MDCEKYYGKCDYSSQKHLEYLRFSLALCSKRTVNICQTLWSKPESRLAWRATLNALDWPEKKFRIQRKTIPFSNYITAPLLRFHRDNKVLPLTILAGTIPDMTPEVPPSSMVRVRGEYHCSGIEFTKPDYSLCKTSKNHTFVSVNQLSLVLLASRIPDDSPPRMLYFKKGFCILPTGKGKATGFSIMCVLTVATIFQQITCVQCALKATIISLDLRESSVWLKCSSPQTICQCM